MSDATHEYEFPLRRGVVITAELPEDLTLEDVERIHAWLRTLPLEEEKGFRLMTITS